MADTKKICFDRLLPSELREQERQRRLVSGPSRAALDIRKLWPNGSTLNVRFLEGTTDQQNTVKRYAPLWSEHANIKFAFGNRTDAEIRIAFRNDGAWSYIGTDCLSIPRNEPTMNFGWLDQAVVLHEFGHAIGLIHEHQNPRGGIQWNREQVIADLSGPPNYWDEATIEHNIFEKYSVNNIRGTEVDPKSIMMYSFPNSWTLNDFHTEFNETLSDQDKAFISSAEAYPRSAPAAVELPVIETTAAEIGQPGEEDLFTFTAAANASYTIETEGPTDVVMTLYGPDSQTRMISQDDDSGEARNAKITASLTPGKYYVQVRHFNVARGTGSYGIRVSKN